ncbi:MAG: hypothetical protein AAF721_21495, partial [Myxococcota bacterium]
MLDSEPVVPPVSVVEPVPVSLPDSLSLPLPVSVPLSVPDRGRENFVSRTVLEAMNARAEKVAKSIHDKQLREAFLQEVNFGKTAIDTEHLAKAMLWGGL